MLGQVNKDLVLKKDKLSLKFMFDREAQPDQRGLGLTHVNNYIKFGKPGYTFNPAVPFSTSIGTEFTLFEEDLNSVEIYKIRRLMELRLPSSAEENGLTFKHKEIAERDGVKFVFKQKLGYSRELFYGLKMQSSISWGKMKGFADFAFMNTCRWNALTINFKGCSYGLEYRPVDAVRLFFTKPSNTDLMLDSATFGVEAKIQPNLETGASYEAGGGLLLHAHWRLFPGILLDCNVRPKSETNPLEFMLKFVFKH